MASSPERKKVRYDLSTMDASSSSSSENESEILPRDLVFQILVRLPVACLLRFKAVCKFWLHLIESSSFISQHIHFSSLKDNQENKLIMLNLNMCTTSKFISIVDLQLPNRVDFELNTDENIWEVRLISSFNGIICLMHEILFRDNTEFGPDWTGVVSLWNPATKHVKILPPPLRLNANNDRVNYGFGFDVKFNDYRVVRVTENVQDNDVIKSNVEVYSLNMDSWRVIDAVMPSEFRIVSDPKRPFKNGDYCWFGIDFLAKCPVIISFNFSNEVFRIITLNEVLGVLPMSNDGNNHEMFSFLGEKLACIHRVSNSVLRRKKRRCEVWVLDTCEAKESWSKLYTFMLHLDFFPLGFSVDGKMILKKYKRNGETDLVLFDPANHKFKNSRIKGKLSTISEAAVYKESLVSFKGANGETYRLDNKWKAVTSTWDATLSQMILQSDKNVAEALDQNAGLLMIFDEPAKKLAV